MDELEILMPPSIIIKKNILTPEACQEPSPTCIFPRKNKDKVEHDKTYLLTPVRLLLISLGLHEYGNIS